MQQFFLFFAGVATIGVLTFPTPSVAADPEPEVSCIIQKDTHPRQQRGFNMSELISDKSAVPGSMAEVGSPEYLVKYTKGGYPRKGLYKEHELRFTINSDKQREVVFKVRQQANPAHVEITAETMLGNKQQSFTKVELSKALHSSVQVSLPGSEYFVSCMLANQNWPEEVRFPAQQKKAGGTEERGTTQ